MEDINQIKDRVNALLLPPLPNSTASLVLGILSIVLCWCWAIIGLALGIIGLIMGNNAIKLYKESPDTYSEASYKNANAGKICSIIGISLSAVYAILIVISWSTYMTLIKSIIDGTYTL